MTQKISSNPPKAKSVELPDVNKETNPFGVVERLLDQAALFSLYAVPEYHSQRLPEDWILVNGGYSIKFNSRLHRFDSEVKPGFEVEQTIGEQVGYLRLRILFCPASTGWRRGSEPSPAIFDAWRSQSFLTSELEVELGGEKNKLSGFAVGQTYPTPTYSGNQTIVCAVGDLGRGVGALSSFAGTITVNGSISRKLGLIGHVALRLPDPKGILTSKVENSISPLPKAIQQQLLEEDKATYILMRGEKASSEVRTEYGDNPSAGLVSLVTPAEMKSVKFGIQLDNNNAPKADNLVGDTVAKLEATVSLDILADPGTPLTPNNFTTTNIYAFQSNDRRKIGTITANVENGKSFELKFPQAPMQPAMRYGGFGRVTSGDGCFEGIVGTLNVNSAIGIQPHALSMLNVLRISTDARKSTTQSTRTNFASQFREQINSETNPFPVVQKWLNEATILNFFTKPKVPARGTQSDNLPEGFASKNYLYLMDFNSDPQNCWVETSKQHVGEFTYRWLLCPNHFSALPNRIPPPTKFDSKKTQRFVEIQSDFSLRGIGKIRCFGTGLTSPTNFDEVVTVLAVGEIISASDSSYSLGAFTLNGTLSYSGGLVGNINFRFPKRNSNIGLFHSSLNGNCVDRARVFGKYLFLSGQKSDRDSQTDLIIDSDGKIKGLSLVQELRSFDVNQKLGVLSPLVNGDVVGQLESKVMINIVDSAEPGSKLSPIPFISLNHFKFFDKNGNVIGTFEVNRGEGRTFAYDFHQSVQQNGFRFGAIGPIENCTGIFEGQVGSMCDNSVVSVAPHVTSTAYVIRFSEKDENTSCKSEQRLGLSYSRLFYKMQSHVTEYLELRRSLRTCATKFSRVIADEFNSRLKTGIFPGLEIPPKALESQLRRPYFSFDKEKFERYRGPAVASHQNYSLLDGSNVNASLNLFSYWEEKSVSVEDWILKRITGSDSRITLPTKIDSAFSADLILNGYSKETGVVSWIQQKNRDRFSVAYSLPRKDETIWFVRNLVPGEENEIMVSHEWKRQVDGRSEYLMVGIFFEFCFESCRIAPKGKTFWRELFKVQ